MNPKIKFDEVSNEKFFDKLNIYYNQKTPFIAYRKKNSLDLMCHVDNNCVSVKSLKSCKPGFFFMPFEQSQTGYKIALENSFATHLKLEKNPHINSITLKKLVAFQKQKKEYLRSISEIINMINKSDLLKVVYSDVFEFKDVERNSIKYFKNLLNLHLDALCYLFYHPNEGCWLGASPETLINLNNFNLKTVALAGTKKKEVNKWTLKEIEEQKIVEKYIVNKLLPICEKVNTTKKETIKAGGIEHLKSTIEAVTRSSVSKVIKAVHPTPAVAGFPLKKALTVIKGLEKHKRSFYTGYFGIVSEDGCETYVNLRCINVTKDRASVYVGGGITHDSMPESEWNEIILKSETILKIFED
tara:strand:- start:3761 stop:4831 length:1071 start_codon:yes stop_codon:yes gene_type:complete